MILLGRDGWLSLEVGDWEALILHEVDLILPLPWIMLMKAYGGILVTTIGMVIILLCMRLQHLFHLFIDILFLTLSQLTLPEFFNITHFTNIILVPSKVGLVVHGLVMSLNIVPTGIRGFIGRIQERV